MTKLADEWEKKKEIINKEIHTANKLRNAS